MIWNGIKQILEYIELSTGLLVICVFGNPYQITNLKENYSADAIFLTYSDVKMSQEAAFKALCGLIDIEGKLPVKLPKPFDKVFKLEA